jgi:hypothetical protein
MGGVDIVKYFDGKLTFKEVCDGIQKLREENALEHGHQDGYSGDWQTISIIDKVNKEFENIDDAYDYCADNCDKRSALAVKAKNENGEWIWYVHGVGAS